MSTQIQHSTEAGDFGFQIAPMVDVVFVLLLFFMAIAGQTQLERTLSAPLPTEQGVPAIPIFIDLDAAGRASIGGQLKSQGGSDHDLVLLTSELRKAMETDPDLVVIRPSPDTAHEYVIDVLNACKKAHVSAIAFR